MIINVTVLLTKVRFKRAHSGFFYQCFMVRYCTYLDAGLLDAAEPLAGGARLRSVFVRGHVNSLVVLPGNHNSVVTVGNICGASVHRLLLQLLLGDDRNLVQPIMKKKKLVKSILIIFCFYHRYFLSRVIYLFCLTVPVPAIPISDSLSSRGNDVNRLSKKISLPAQMFA